MFVVAVKGAVTSKDLISVIDDAIKSADDIKNKDIRQAMEDNWNAVIVSMFEGARAICLGTRFNMMIFIVELFTI